MRPEPPGIQLPPKYLRRSWQSLQLFLNHQLPNPFHIIRIFHGLLLFSTASFATPSLNQIPPIIHSQVRYDPSLTRCILLMYGNNCPGNIFTVNEMNSFLRLDILFRLRNP